MACKKFEVSVNSTKVLFEDRFVTAAQIISASGQDYAVIEQVFSGGERKIILKDEQVDLGAPGVERFEAYSECDVHYFNLNNELRAIGERNANVQEIIERGGKFPAKDFALVETISDIESILIDSKEKVTFEKGCKRNFFTFPKDQVYTFKVDKGKFVTEKTSLTGEEILLTAGLTPVNEYELIQKFCGKKRERIELGDVVDLTVPGIEKFVSIPLDQREG